MAEEGRKTSTPSGTGPFSFKKKNKKKTVKSAHCALAAAGCGSKKGAYIIAAKHYCFRKNDRKNKKRISGGEGQAGTRH